MMLVLVLSVLISFVSAFNDTVSLIDLDKRLTDLLVKPEKGKGSLLLSDGYFLYTNLDDVSDMIEAKHPKGAIIYNEIEKAGGIKLFRATYDPDKVRETFQYNRDEYEMLMATIGGIENTWKSIQIPICLTSLDPPPGCGIPHHNYTIEPEWEKLFSAGQNMTLFYKTAGSGNVNGHGMVRTAIIYLEQLEKLEKSVDENRGGSMDAVWELYVSGGPLHLKQIPYNEFIETFKWDSKDIDEYATLIDNTRRVWGRLVEELERLAPKDIVI